MRTVVEIEYEPRNTLRSQLSPILEDLVLFLDNSEGAFKDYSGAGWTATVRRADATAADSPQPDSRAAFEAWFKSKSDLGWLNRMTDGGYNDPRTQLAWEAWQQARREQEPVGAALAWRNADWGGRYQWDAVSRDQKFTLFRESLADRWTVKINGHHSIGFAGEPSDEMSAIFADAEARLRAFFAAGLSALSAPPPSAGTGTTVDE